MSPLIDYSRRAGSIAARRKVAGVHLPSFLQRLETLTMDGLRMEWARHFADPCPNLRSGDVLRRLIAWRVQASLLGGYDQETIKRLRQLIGDQSADRPLVPKHKPRLSPGTVLSREWKGQVHRVSVETKGFTYEGRRFGSLSEIAREITGTRWSGPRLFGLDVRGAA